MCIVNIFVRVRRPPPAFPVIGVLTILSRLDCTAVTRNNLTDERMLVVVQHHKN